MSNTVAVCGASCNNARTVPAGHAKASFGSQVGDFFSNLFSTSSWPARWHCGTWSDFHGWLYILSDTTIWASYFAIPLLLMRMLRKRDDIPFPKIIWLFVAFIIFCGTTHVMDAIIFWWPAYRLSALIRLFTAIVSAVAVYALYKVMPLIFSLRSVKELEYEINQRKIAEEKLAASEFLLREAGRIGRVGGWEYDLVSKKTTWSDTVYDIFGVPCSYLANNENDFEFFSGPVKKSIKEIMPKSIVECKGFDKEVQIKTASGATLWISICGECFQNEAGETTKLKGVIMDIDKYKNNELALNKSHEMLFESHRQLRTFTHILSHNIRNHASNISSLTDLVDTNQLDESNAGLFEKIGKVSNALNCTLKDLSEAIMIRENSVAAEVVSFQDITQYIAGIIELDILTNAVCIKTDYRAETVMFPRIYMESILMNLITNSIKYQKPDEAPRISLRSYLNKNGDTVLECTDNGLGINLKLHGKKVFGLYKTFHEHKDAHGVGLFLVKTQVESQGGRISVASEPGKGTTFKVMFNPHSKINGHLLN
jgi:two-component sensor histidine kinase